jgi:preprotein translocase subunit SecG
MGFLILLFTLVMVLDCAVLIFLILIQLPKKDAGAGLAFGGGATDALFGAGSGNVLTKITKYAAGAFFILAVLLSVMQRNYHGAKPAEFLQKLEAQGQPGPGAFPGPAPATAPAAPSAAPAAAVTGTNLMSAPIVEDSKLPTPTTNSVPVPAPPK